MLKKEIIKYVTLTLICFILYLPVLSFYFCGDDFDMIKRHGFYETVKCFYTRCDIYENKAGWYRPLNGLLMFFEHKIWNYNPFGYHLTNLILHILNTIVVYLLAKALIKKDNIAFLSSVFFATHPIHTEAVVWVSPRSTLLATLFYLSSLVYFIKYLDLKKNKFYIISILFFVLSLFSKEEAITLPVVILFYDFIFGKKFIFKNKIKIYLPYFSLLIIYFLFKLFILKSLGGYGTEFAILKYPFPFYIKYFTMNQLKMLYLPYYYPDLLLPWFSIFFIVILPFALFYLKLKDYTFLCGFLLISIIPYINLETGIHMGGWYMYLPSVSFCILISLLIFLFLKHSLRLFKAVGLFFIVTILIIYIYTTVNRINDWMVASELCRNIPLKIKDFMQDVKPNTKIYVYGIPHNYNGAYVYNNGFENSLRMTFNNNLIKGFPIFLLEFPIEIFKNNLNSYYFAFIDGDIFKIIFHPDKKNHLLFVNKSGKYFDISFEKYHKLTERIIRSYTDKDGGYPSIKQMEINERIIKELIRNFQYNKR